MRTERIVTKTRLYNFDPFKPHLGFTGGKHCLFLFLHKNINCGYSLDPPRLGGERPTIYVLSRNMKNIKVFYLKFFEFSEMKFSIYLNRRVFVMICNFDFLSLPTRDILRVTGILLNDAFKSYSL